MSQAFYPIAIKMLIGLQVLMLFAYLVFSVMHFRDYFALTLVSGAGIIVLTRVYSAFMGETHRVS